MAHRVVIREEGTASLVGPRSASPSRGLMMYLRRTERSGSLRSTDWLQVAGVAWAMHCIRPPCKSHKESFQDFASRMTEGLQERLDHRYRGALRIGLESLKE